VARGIGRVAKEIIVAGGGPFEFGAHEFTEAELSGLGPGVRKRCADGLGRLRSALNDQFPPGATKATCWWPTGRCESSGPWRRNGDCPRRSFIWPR
jgi:hypothetical protein